MHDTDTNFKIGEGQFGTIYKAWMNYYKNPIEVVAKTSTEFSSDLQEILHEMRTALKVGDHPNILHFYGITSNSTGSQIHAILLFD